MRYGKHEGNWNWHSFNVDPSTPADIIRLFEIESNAFTPSNFNVLSLKAYDGSYSDLIRYISHSGGFGQMRVRYGFYEPATTGGREYMISNAFLSVANSDSLDDPNALIEISGENFEFLYEENPNYDSAVKKENTFSIKSAMDTLKITQKEMNEIMRCVFITMYDKRNHSTFFVVPEYSEEKIRALAYLILSFLPHPLRYGISFSNADNSAQSESKNFVVIGKAITGENYYNIETGETSFNLDIVSKRIYLFPFCERLEKDGVENYSAYCMKVKKAAGLFDFKINPTYNDILLLSRIMLKEKYYSELSQDKLIEYLEEITNCPWKKTDVLKEYFVGLINYVLKVRCVLKSELYDQIYVWVNEIASQQFFLVYQELQVLRLLQFSEEELFAFLDKKDEADDDWIFWLDNMFKMSEDKEKVQAEVLKYTNKRIDDCDNINSLKSVGEGLLGSSFYKLVRANVFLNLTNLYATQINNSINSVEKIEKLLLDYKQDVIFLLGVDPNGFEAKKSRYLKAISEQFLEIYDINSFTFETSYINGIERLMQFVDFSENVKFLISAYNATGHIALATEINDEIDSYLKIICNINLLSKSFDNKLVERLYSFIVEKLKSNQFLDITFWYKLTEYIFSSSYPDCSVAKCMFNYRLPFMVDENSFQYAISSDVVSEEFLSTLIKDYELFIEEYNSKSAEGKFLKNCLALLKKQKKSLDKNKKSKSKNHTEKKVESVRRSQDIDRISDKMNGKNSMTDDSESTGISKVTKKLFSVFHKE